MKKEVVKKYFEDRELLKSYLRREITREELESKGVKIKTPI